MREDEVVREKLEILDHADKLRTNNTIEKGEKKKHTRNGMNVLASSPQIHRRKINTLFMLLFSTRL